MELLLVAADGLRRRDTARLRAGGWPTARQLRQGWSASATLLVVDGAGGGEHHVAGMVVPREIGADRVRA
jgi:hypothetical protein